MSDLLSLNGSDLITILETLPHWPQRKHLKKSISLFVSQTLSYLRTRQPQSKFWSKIFSYPLELTIVLSHDEELQTLNYQWLKKNNPTNVLSFPALNENIGQFPPGASQSFLFLGDIILSYERCKKESEETGKQFEHHITHLIIHGLLHLLGMTHDGDKDAEHMESLEVELLQKLSISNPYEEA